MDATLDQWFADEILVHEDELVRYLRRVWSQPEEVFDLRQDIYVRIYEAAARARPSQPRAFLYATARNLMADRVRRGRIVSIEMVGDLESMNVIMEEPGLEERAGHWQELKVLAEAMDRLPPRCREVLWLNKVAELTYPEVAARLGVSVKTVEKQMSKGIKRLAEFYLQRASAERAGAADARTSRERPHG